MTKLKISFYLFFAFTFGILALGCTKSNSENQPNVGKNVPIKVLKISTDDIGPAASMPYKEWSEKAQSQIMSTIGSQCVSDEFIYFSVRDEASARTVASAVGAGDKFAVVSYSQDEISQICSYAYANSQTAPKIITLNSGQHNFQAEVYKLTFNYFNITSVRNFVTSNDDVTISLEISYPKKYRYANEDLDLILNLLKNKYGENCCLIENKVVN